LTGGEPLLQADQVFFDALHELGFYIAVETNGTVWINPSSVDWLCVSPKAGTNLLVQKGHELKFVYPQADMSPNQFENMDFEVFSIQPMDNKNQAENIKSAIHFCLLNPKWHFSMQVHKIAGIR
jgi:7-carboxy-7-deazaguanine synthase